jgi:hypothetical protein
VRAALAALPLLVLGLSGCAAGVSSTTVDGVTVLSQSRSSSEQREALFVGTLGVDKGCLMLVDEEGYPHGLVLPEAADVTVADGVVSVTIDGAAYGIHDEVRLGGGFSVASHSECAFDDYFEPNGQQS